MKNSFCGAHGPQICIKKYVFLLIFISFHWFLLGKIRKNRQDIAIFLYFLIFGYIFRYFPIGYGPWKGPEPRGPMGSGKPSPFSVWSPRGARAQRFRRRPGPPQGEFQWGMYKSIGPSQHGALYCIGNLEILGK